MTWCLGVYKDKNAILQDAPVSTKEFDETWKQQCAFEVLGRAWLPTPSALAMVWKSILSAATVSSVNLEEGFDLKSLAEMVGNDGFPWALFIAVMTSLVSDADHLNDNSEYRTSSRAVLTSDLIVKDIHLSRDKTVLWVGIVCLQRAGESEQANKEGIMQKDFLTQWHDLLPEGWRKHAPMDLLKVQKSSITFLLSRPDKMQTRYSYSDPSKETIVISEDIRDPTSLETLPSAVTGGKVNRKWHDKFKMGRK